MGNDGKEMRARKDGAWRLERVRREGSREEHGRREGEGGEGE